jgi:hypothetical protein
MTVLIELVDNFAVWIYIACALTILAYLRVIYLAKKERGASLFTIEKEVATGRAYRATFTILGLLVIIGLVAFVDVYLAPTLGVAISSSTPEGPVVLPTSTSTPVPPTPTPVVTRGPLVRPTPPWTPTPEQSPTPTAAQASCPDPMSRISYPGVNQTVSGVVEIRGTAKMDAFWYYKVEFSFGQGGNEFHVIDDLKYTTVEDGVLVVWNTGELSGPVTLRLTVVKTDGNYLPPCDVPVNVQ